MFFTAGSQGFVCLRRTQFPSHVLWWAAEASSQQAAVLQWCPSWEPPQGLGVSCRLQAMPWPPNPRAGHDPSWETSLHCIALPGLRLLEAHRSANSVMLWMAFSSQLHSPFSSKSHL